MTFRKLHTVVAVAGIALAGSGAWWYQSRPSLPAPQADTMAQGPGAAGPQRASGSAGQGSGGGGAVAVEVGKVQAIRIEDDAQAVGSVRSRQSVLLRPEVSGRIQKLPFADGQRVQRGQLLVQLDDTLQAAQLKQAQAQASIARTNLQRSRELQAQNFVSQSAVDQNAANLEVAEAQVALAQAQLARMKIVAPFDGVLGIRVVSVGDYVKDGADLVSIEDISSVWVDFRLAERFVERLRTAQPVEVALDAMPGRTFRGKVDALDSQVDANGRSLLVRARLGNPDALLRSGMFARARIVFATRERALVVPEEALVPLGGKQYLYKAVEGPGGRVSQRIEARIGIRVPGKAEILEGVNEGDLVVTAGQNRLLRGDGLPLRVVDLGRIGAAAGSAPAGAGSAAGRGGPRAGSGAPGATPQRNGSPA